MFKGLKDIASLMNQAREIQGRMGEMQETLKKIRVLGSAGGEMVTVEANGAQQILSCRIDPSLFQTSDQEMIEDLVVAATNQALDKAKQAAADEMGKLSGGLNLPGLKETLSSLGLG
ncbi:MAG: YbaB/EbfC family nucleoid-associated protein [Planctomycetales bacterium]